MSTDMNGKLLKEFTKEEVYQALQQMGAFKSLEPDGFGAHFYQSYWETVREEVCITVLNFINGGTLDPNLNYTFITLIPKVNCPTKVNEF